MKFFVIIIFAFMSLPFFGQMQSSSQRIISQPLNVVSEDPSNPDNVIISTAVALPSQKFTTSQSATLVLNPESNSAHKSSNPEIIISEAKPLPAQSHTTSQSGSLKLNPVKSPDKN